MLQKFFLTTGSLLVMLAACAPTPPAVQQVDRGSAQAPASGSSQAVDSNNISDLFTVPEQVNATPFDSVLLTGRCGEGECTTAGEYFSLGTMVAFDMDAQGRLKVSPRQEAILNERDDPAHDGRCSTRGAAGNHRTVWFPYTGILVRGGVLESVVNTGNKERVDVVPLKPIEQGLMMVVGPRARKVEYAYVPCVGAHRVATGYRLGSYLPPGATLRIKSGRAKGLTLTLPDRVEPYAMLHYKVGAMIPVPMRPTLVMIDAIDRRVVVNYQSTFSVVPPLRKVELRAVLPDQQPSEGESPDRLRERTEATLRDLRACPTGYRPVEPCATPNRRP